jgi:hypothetical protein
MADPSDNAGTSFDGLVAVPCLWAEPARTSVGRGTVDNNRPDSGRPPSVACRRIAGNLRGARPRLAPGQSGALDVSMLYFDIGIGDGSVSPSMAVPLMVTQPHMSDRDLKGLMPGTGRVR